MSHSNYARSPMWEGSRSAIRMEMSFNEAGNGGETHSTIMVTLSMPPKRSFVCFTDVCR
jgi:hypothetical protein